MKSSPDKQVDTDGHFTPNARSVQQMFGSIAKRYDLANDVLSMGAHYQWRATLEQRMHPCDLVLDVATGTGAMIPYLLRKAERVIGVDFSAEMLENAPQKLKNNDRVELLASDALKLPFPNNQFDCVTVAFGVRNFESLTIGLAELNRVLKPNGQLLVLEFGQVRHPVLAWGYKAYSKYVMPLVGNIITGNKNAYTYLPETSARFPCGENFEEFLKSSGFTETKSLPLWCGISYLYDSKK
jgi:demethylmenaquinone methyltransferase / 2-methoxy-6-polyprenyl-1,4-benzoquinol methylase